jgi:hypothetical protein
MALQETLHDAERLIQNLKRNVVYSVTVDKNRLLILNSFVHVWTKYIYLALFSLSSKD